VSLTALWLKRVRSSFDADPDPAFECDEDPDLAFYFHADPDPRPKIMRIRIRNLALNPDNRYSANSLKNFTSVAGRHHIVSDPDLDFTPISVQALWILLCVDYFLFSSYYIPMNV
jgi:hypothetical protein